MDPLKNKTELVQRLSKKKKPCLKWTGEGLTFLKMFPEVMHILLRIQSILTKR